MFNNLKRYMAKLILSLKNKNNNANNMAIFTCDKEQTRSIRQLLAFNNKAFLDTINYLNLEIIDNQYENTSIFIPIKIQGKASDVLKFIYEMRIKFQFSSFQEYIDVSRIHNKIPFSPKQITF